MAGLPIISVDAKKKELIGNFKNEGQQWCKEAERVNVYDFPQYAVGRASPYGIFNINLNRGYVFIGTSSDTPQFAVDSISKWWQEFGIYDFAGKEQLLILADGGGSNSYRSRVWKHQIQEQLCDQFGLKVTVCHYPRGCSKWNPIEHGLFSYISINWAAIPLRSYEIMLSCIENTKTISGLQVKASLVEAFYQKGQKVSDSQMEAINILRKEVCPSWNYTIAPKMKKEDKNDNQQEKSKPPYKKTLKQKLLDAVSFLFS